MHKSLDFIRNNNYSKIDKELLNNKKNIIFLDIDGVIQPYNNQIRFEHNMDETINYLVEKYKDDTYRSMDIYDVCAAFYDWDEVAIGLLSKILRNTNSYIVVHSSWREYNNLEQLKCLFKLYNLESYVFDVCDKGDKIKVIEKYLNEHKDFINEFIVLDDFDMTSKFGYNFIRTYNCLNSKNYEQSIKVLNNKYKFDLKDDFLNVYSKDKKIIQIPFKNIIIKDKKVFYIQILNCVNYVNDIDYFIVGNFLIKYLNDLDESNISMVILGYIKDDLLSYINKMYPLKRIYSEYDAIFGYPLNDRNFKGIKFFNENYGIIIEKIKDIKW